MRIFLTSDCELALTKKNVFSSTAKLQKLLSHSSQSFSSLGLKFALSFLLLDYIKSRSGCWDFNVIFCSKYYYYEGGNFHQKCFQFGKNSFRYEMGP